MKAAIDTVLLQRVQVLLLIADNTSLEAEVSHIVDEELVCIEDASEVLSLNLL